MGAIPQSRLEIRPCKRRVSYDYGEPLWSATDPTEADLRAALRLVSERWRGVALFLDGKPVALGLPGCTCATVGECSWCGEPVKECEPSEPGDDGAGLMHTACPRDAS